MMKKVLEEFTLLLIAFLFPLAIILLIPGDGSISLLPVLPIVIIGGIATIRLAMKNQLCFERWINSSPKITVPIILVLFAAVVCTEMRIVISSKLPELAIPHPQPERKEVEQTLADEFPEFR